MSDAFLALLLLSVPIFVFGMVKPAIFRGGRLRAAGVAFAVFCAGFIGFGVTTSGERSVRANVPPNTSASAPLVVISTTTGADERQAAFVAMVANAREAWRTADNDMMRGGIRTRRADDMCQLLRPPAVTDWVGSIDARSSRNDGRGVLSIRLAPDLTLATGSTDAGTIPANSALFNQVAALQRGQQVVFSGVFQRSGNDCLAEMSLTVRSAMLEPQFRFVFTDVRPLR